MAVIVTQLHDVAEFDELVSEPPAPVRTGSAQLFYKKGEGLKLKRFGLPAIGILLAEEQDSADAVIQAEVTEVPTGGKIPRASAGGVIDPGWIGAGVGGANRVVVTDADGKFTTDAKLTWDSGDGILITNQLAFTDLGGDPGDSNRIGYNDAITAIVVGKNFRAGSGYIESGSEYKVAGTRVVGPQGAAVADAAGGVVIDVQARAQLNLLLAALRSATGHGLIA